MLWWVNRSLHLLGWAIVVGINDKGKIENVYPARVKFRGFSSEVEENGFKALSNLIKKDADALAKEANE